MSKGTLLDELRLNVLRHVASFVILVGANSEAIGQRA